MEVKPLSNEIVRAMLNDAATSGDNLELLPYLATGFSLLRLSRRQSF
jgi:hypothetical protein